MENALIYSKIARLPEELQKEVNDFVDFLLIKHKDKIEKKESVKPMFGALKGQIIMSEDFDEPLEDFKDYM